MSEVKREQLNVPDASKLKDNQRFDVLDDVIIALSQAFCSKGHRMDTLVCPDGYTCVSCDGCERSTLQEDSLGFYNCNTCDYNLCWKCGPNVTSIFRSYF